MEIELQKNRDTLFHNLTEWHKIERDFKNRMPKESFGERGFLKLRLAEYDRLHRRHRGDTMTRDERVMAIMLRIERNAIERHLYPGLMTRMLSRMLRRTAIFLSPPINTVKELEMVREAGMQSYLSNWMESIPVRPEQWQSPGQQEPTVKAAMPEYGASERMVQNESLAEKKVATNHPSVKELKETPQQEQPSPKIQGQSKSTHQWKPKPPRNRDTRLSR